MSDPLSNHCTFCGSDVLDDAWFCDRPGCWDSWQNGMPETHCDRCGSELKESEDRCASCKLAMA